MIKKTWLAISLILIIIATAVIVLLHIGGGSHNAIDNDPEAEVSGNSNILVAYFSWSGNGQQMASWIAEETGGELFRIVPQEAYGEDFDSTADRAQTELNNGTRPALSSHIDSEIMEQYDMIYLGFSIWWYDLPTPVWTFLEEYDLSDKTIIPFFSHNGSSSGANSINRVVELANGATVLTDDVLSIAGSRVEDSEETIKQWAATFDNEQ